VYGPIPGWTRAQMKLINAMPYPEIFTEPAGFYAVKGDRKAGLHPEHETVVAREVNLC